MAIKLVVSDDHPLILDGLEGLLRLEKDFKVLARCATGEETLKAVERHKPDVLILDIRLPQMDGLDVMQRIKERELGTRVVLLTAAVDESQMVKAIRLGVGGVVLKETAPRMLIECIRKVHAGEQWFEKGALGRTLERLLQQEVARGEVTQVLSPREIEIAKKLALGLSNKDIAKQLFISEGTVKIHLHNIYYKLRMSGRFQLIQYAQQKGLVDQ
jgi:DNA-binding NarL/FixJ family response regulator